MSSCWTNSTPCGSQRSCRFDRREDEATDGTLSQYQQIRSNSLDFTSHPEIDLELPYLQFSFEFPHRIQDVFWKCRVCVAYGSTACQPATADELV
jgi:hypothetical protein